VVIVVLKTYPQIPLNPPFTKGEVFRLPLAKGGREGFYKDFFKLLKSKFIKSLNQKNPPFLLPEEDGGMRSHIKTIK
jgi:hypothetical protein